MDKESKNTKKKKTDVTENSSQAEAFDIEKALARLEEINSELSKSGTTLKASMELYREGVELAEKCKVNLEGVEKEIQILSADE
jgi:exodeoxyribonuclease VII small subunit